LWLDVLAGVHSVEARRRIYNQLVPIMQLEPTLAEHLLYAMKYAPGLEEAEEKAKQEREKLAKRKKKKKTKNWRGRGAITQKKMVKTFLKVHSECIITFTFHCSIYLY
jgi:hypothetical protein